MSTLPTPPTPGRERWWISGATGSWGQELVSQALDKGHEVVAFCRGEYRAWQLLEAHPGQPLTIFLGDIRDRTRVQHSLKGIDVVVHGAALKRIDTALSSPTEMASVNIQGTQAVIDGCIENLVKRAFYISTDKACEPTTFYGASKLVAESLWLSARGLGGVQFIGGRFGNALDSTGSVLQVWRSQMERGQPVSLRDPLMTRFIMAIPWAVTFIRKALQESHLLTELAIPLLRATTVGDLKVAFCGARWPTISQPLLLGEKQHESLRPGVTSNQATLLTGDELRTFLRVANINLPTIEWEEP